MCGRECVKSAIAPLSLVPWRDRHSPMFLGADLPSGRPSSAAEVKGGAAGTGATRRAKPEHGEDPPFDRSEHDGIWFGWGGSSRRGSVMASHLVRGHPYGPVASEGAQSQISPASARRRFALPSILQIPKNPAGSGVVSGSSPGCITLRRHSPTCFRTPIMRRLAASGKLRRTASEGPAQPAEVLAAAILRLAGPTRPKLLSRAPETGSVDAAPCFHSWRGPKICASATGKWEMPVRPSEPCLACSSGPKST